MKLVQYNGPGALLRVAGRMIPRGGTDEVPDRDAAALEESPHYDVTVTETGDGKPEADAGEGHPTDSESENEEAT